MTRPLPRSEGHDAAEASAPPGASSQVGRGGPSAGACPLCASEDSAYLFVSHGGPVYRCVQCGLTRSWPQPPKSRLLAFHSGSGGRDRFADDAGLGESLTEHEAAATYLDELERRGASRSRMLLIAPAGHPFAGIAT